MGTSVFSRTSNMKVILLLLAILAFSNAQYGGGYYGYRPYRRPGRWYRPGWGMGGGWRHPGFGMGYHRPGFGFGMSIGKRNAEAEPEAEPEAEFETPIQPFSAYPVSNYWGFYPMPNYVPVPMTAPCLYQCLLPQCLLKLNLTTLSKKKLKLQKILK